MAMALTTVPESVWFEFDERYADEMAEKQQLLRERHRDVFAALPVSDAARLETLHEIIANLTTYARPWFVRDGEMVGPCHRDQRS